MITNMADMIVLLANELILRDANGHYDNSAYYKNRGLSENGQLTIETEGALFRFEVNGRFGGWLKMKANENNIHVMEEWSDTKYVTVLVTKPHSSFIYVSDNYQDRNGKPEQFRNLSNHDSCWSSPISDEINKLCWPMRDAILESAEAVEGYGTVYEKLCPHVYEYVKCSRNVFGKFITPVTVVLEKRVDDNYFWNVLKITEKKTVKETA